MKGIVYKRIKKKEETKKGRLGFLCYERLDAGGDSDSETASVNDNYWNNEQQ